MIESRQVKETLCGVVSENGLTFPLSQVGVKKVVVLTIDRLIGAIHDCETPVPAIYANRLEFSGEPSLLKFTRHEPCECMVDVAVFRGTVDPYEVLATAESEAYPQHEISENSTSNTSDYLWDLYKLLQVPSPMRLFVACVTGRERCSLLEDRIGFLIDVYSDLYRQGDQIFSVVLPASRTHPTDFSVFGWVQDDGLREI